MICESLKTKTNNEGTIISELLKNDCVCVPSSSMVMMITMTTIIDEL